MTCSYESSKFGGLIRQRQPGLVTELMERVDSILVDGEIWQGSASFVKCSCSFLSSELYAFIYLSQYRIYLDPIESTAPKISVTNMCIFSYTILGDSMMRSLVGSNTIAMEIHTKDARIIKLFFDNSEDLDRVVGHIQNYSFFSKSYEPITTSCPIFAFVNYPLMSTQTTTWKYSLEDEFRRMNICTNWSKDFEIFENKDYSYFPTYPLKILKPRSSTKSDLLGSAKFRSSSRLPTPTWIHPETRATISRCSQPLSGLCKRCEADENLVLAIWKANKSYSCNGNTTLHNSISVASDSKYCANTGKNRFSMYILDARSLTAARANIVKGGGYESVPFYGNAIIDFLNIHNIHVVRNSYLEFSNLFMTSNAPSRDEIYETHWFENLKNLMNGANRVVELVESKRSVLVHCSDGWDRTTQLVATAQILMDPFYRTTKGFCILIQKEWISFGHKFADRTPIGRSGFDSEAAPIFLQWMDLISQCMCQYPTAFEFTDAFLVLIVDCLFDGRFTSFFWNCEADQSKYCPENAKTVWPYLESKFSQNSAYLINKNYIANGSNRSLRPSSSIEEMRVWESFHCRYQKWECKQPNPVDNLDHLMERIDLDSDGAIFWKMVFLEAKNPESVELRRDLSALNEIIKSGELLECNIQFLVRDGKVARCFVVNGKSYVEEVGDGSPMKVGLKSFAIDDYYPLKSLDHPNFHHDRPNIQLKATKKSNGIIYYKTQFLHTLELPKINSLLQWGKKWGTYVFNMASDVVYSYYKNEKQIETK